MSEVGLSFDEEPLSPDIFSDGDTSIAANNPVNSNDSSLTSIGVNEPEPTDNTPEWKGVSMDEIRKNLGTYDCQELPPIRPSSSHTVLISVPMPARGPPKPYPSNPVDKWCQGFVRMPHSTHSVYPIDQSGSRRCRNKWEIIQESLLQNFVSTQQLETAILSYNHIYAQRWDFAALHHFFSEVVDEEETNIFFDTLIPKMVQLALQLPVLITGPIPLLKSHTNGSISLSQLQVACLLANAFFCTFPRRNSTNPQSEYGSYPYINFNRLFSAYKEDKRNRCEPIMEKLKCFFHYFRRVTSKAPEGVITIERRYIPKQDCPKWDQQHYKLPLLHLTSRGTIETDGAGLLQVDFANKYLGGGVLGLGCVQEEIRFAICPELLVTMLVTEALDDTEALIVSGIERYSKYKGYSNTFKWMGDFVDETPRDSSGRRMTTIVAIDALYFKQPLAQFSISNITRELNKAYVGFAGSEGNKQNLPAVATGNWGCGAFRGNPKLKVLVQLMAAAVTGRSIVYFTFGDTNLRDDIAEMYCHFVQQETDIAHLFSLLVQYQEFASNEHLDFYRFLYNRSKIKPLTKYFPVKDESSPRNDTKPKEPNSFKRSKSLNIDEKRPSSRFNVMSRDTEEERIQSWLASYDNDLENSEQIETPKSEDEKGTVHTRTTKDCKSQDGNSTEHRTKQSFWKSFDEKGPSKTVSDRRISGLDLLDVKQDLASYTTKDNDVSTPVEQSVVSVEDDEKCETVEKERARSSPRKKSEQRKISDFFQRTS